MPKISTISLVVLLFACAAAQANPFARHARKANEGFFTDGQVSVLCFADGEEFAGTLELKGVRYPLRARLVDGGLRGSFEANGQPIAFFATVTGDEMQFQNEDWSGTLKRKPLARLTGRWISKDVTVVVQKSEHGYAGMVLFQENRMPFLAEEQAGGLVGQFRDGNERVAFEIQRRKDHLVFVVGNYRMRVDQETEKARAARLEPIKKQAKAELDAKNYSAAIDAYSQLIEEEPDELEHFKGRADAFYQTNQYIHAAEDYKQVIASQPTAFFHNRLGVCLEMLKQYDASISQYSAAMLLDPKYKWALANRGDVRRKQKDYARAIDDLTQAIELDGKYTFALYTRGLAHSSNGDQQRAIADLNKAIELKPDTAIYYVNLGIVWAHAEEYTKAIADYSAAIEIDSELTTAYKNRALAYGESGNHLAKINDYLLILRFRPDEAYAHNGAAWAYAACPDARLHNGEKAVRHALAACEATNFERAGYIDTLAVAYARAGDIAQAVKYQQQAIDVFGRPEDEAGRATLDRFHQRLAMFRDGLPYQEEAEKQPAVARGEAENNSPAMGLEGYCPVTLLTRRQWIKGDPRLAATYQGHIYLFAGQREKELFFDNADAYSPALAGHDPIVYADNRQMVPGNIQFGSFHENRLYLFQTDENRRLFKRSPESYAAEAEQAFGSAGHRNMNQRR